jgi:anti-anti-sigma factor
MSIEPHQPSQYHPHAVASDPADELAFTRVQMTRQENIIFLTLADGKTDGQAVRELYEVSAQITDHYNIRVVLDLVGASYVPSGMMGMLITVKKKIASVGGQFHVVVADPLIKTSFLAMKLDRILSLYDTMDEALSSFKH